MSGITLDMIYDLFYLKQGQQANVFTLSETPEYTNLNTKHNIYSDKKGFITF